MTEVPLRRNRDFLLLQAGQLFSNAGTAATTVAYPLLVLATAHSAALAGFVTFMRTLPAVLFSLPGGVAADRFDRKMLMIVSDACRAAAVGSLGAAILSGHFASWQIPVVAFAEGSFAALFGPAAAGALRSVVPPRQLPAAVAGQTGRLAAANLAGPPLGGALFGLSRALPFAADAASYTCSLVSLIMMGTPFQEPRPGSGKGLALRDSSRRVSGSCGASHSCAPRHSSTASPTSSALACSWRSSSSARGKGCQAGRSER